ncbi:uncharacterized protein [Excalfactoria chinensis]|uniref:uncharacterized protein n=1 Tax=Excalfactoria chinensis TaxID=46218 RepID=UPI003B3AEF81
MLLQTGSSGLCLLLLSQSCWLKAARGLEEAVKCESITEATLGQEANFSCYFLLPMNVLQVTWQKINGSSFRNIATYSQTHGLRMLESFQRKARFTVEALNASAITLQNLTSEDASCYRCIFNVFPYGSFSSPDLCLKIRKSGNANIPEVKTLDMDSPIQEVFLVFIFFFSFSFPFLFLFFSFSSRQQKHRAHYTPAKKKDLQQDVCEQSISLKTLKVQGSAYQNERQTIKFSLHKRQLNLRRNWEENKERKTWKTKKRLMFSEDAGSQDSTSHNIPQGELTDLSSDILGCTLEKNNSVTEACGESELCPALATTGPSTAEKSSHQSDAARSPEEP